jgi:hypothetical protein
VFIAALSADAVQFQVTVTSEKFQPAGFAAGDCVGAAVGTHAETATVLCSQLPAPEPRKHALRPLQE